MATIQLTFYIYLTDQDRVRDLQAQYPAGITHGPLPASIEFDAPYQLDSVPFAAPCTRTNWFNGQPTDKLPITDAVFRKKSGALWGLAGLFGFTQRYVWVGQFVWAASHTAPVEGSGTGPNEIDPIPQRRWIDGREGPSTAGALGGAASQSVNSRAASRTVDGLGTAIRSRTATTTHVVMDFQGGGASTTRRSWERLYVRLRRLPTTPVAFWNAQALGGAGVHLYVAPTGQLVVYGDDGSVRAVAGIGGVLPLNTWVKLDLGIYFKPQGGSPIHVECELKLFINGVLSVTASPTIFPTSGTNLFHHESVIGATGAGHSLELDIDDWICADAPARVQANTWDPATTYALNDYASRLVSGITRYYRATAGSTNQQPPNVAYWIQVRGPVDWFAGSHVRLLRPVAFGAQHDAAAWPGDVKTIEKSPLTSDGSLLTSVTALGVLQVEMDQVNRQSGAVAVSAGVFGAHTSGGSTMGIGVNGGAPSMVTPFPPQTATAAWSSALYRPSGLAAPTDVGLVRVQVTKANNATSATTNAILAAVEYIGLWGPEDFVTDPDASPAVAVTDLTFAPRQSVHNAPYPDSPWAVSMTPPVSGVQIIAGTYTGNGANLYNALEVALGARWPIHFWMARRATVSTGITWWWSSMLSPHRALEGSAFPSNMSRALKNPTYVSPGTELDPEEKYVTRLSGNDNNANVNTGVYQFLAVCDPGQRFLLNGAFGHGAHAVDASVINTLADSGFTPTFGLLSREWLIAPMNTASHILGKGPGSAAAGASVLDAAETAAALTFAAGSLTSQAAMHGANYEQVAYALMRAVEPGSTDPGVVFQIGSYVGDGAASRTIALAPASGFRPLFAIIIPTGGTSYMRDPSHLTTASSPMAGGATIATGITAGSIDGFTVGVTLNANGVNHSYLVIPGSATAGNGGWSINGEFNPVAPAMPFGDQWPDPTITEAQIDQAETPSAPSTTPTPLAEEPDFDNTTDLPDTSQVCEYFSRKICNIALSRIGVSKQITDLNADLGQEASTARLHLKDDVEATLRDFDWPFATRYATLVLVGGTSSVPVNTDWQYSYRLPLGMVKARRVAPQGGQKRLYDPHAITFALGSDAGGNLLYTDAAATTDIPLILEYTFRMTCPAYQGDALFRDALAWRVAASFAAPLSRDEKKQQFCLGMYRVALATAEVAAANEARRDIPGDADWITGRN